MLDAGHLTAAMSGLEVSGRKRKTGATKLLGNEPSEGGSGYDHVYSDRDFRKTDNSRFPTNLKSRVLENQVSYIRGLVIVAKQDFSLLNRFPGL